MAASQCLFQNFCMWLVLICKVITWRAEPQFLGRWDDRIMYGPTGTLSRVEEKLLSGKAEMNRDCRGQTELCKPFHKVSPVLVI